MCILLSSIIIYRVKKEKIKIVIIWLNFILYW